MLLFGAAAVAVLIGRVKLLLRPGAMPLLEALRSTAATTFAYFLPLDAEARR